VANLSRNVASSDDAEAITASDTVVFTKARVTRGVYVGVGGNVVALIGGSAITFSNVPTGMILPISCTRINSTSTTATNMVALF